MLSLAEDMLAELGYEPNGYPNGEQALAAFSASPDRFDAVLSDERMPGLSGLELAARLKAVRSTLPVVIATGYGGPDLEQRARAVGVAEIVSKPYTLAALSQALSRTLRG
jgi:DNA-binding NtrC family response regulator